MAVLLTEEQVNAVRERIREVAERQLAERGPDATSLRSIAGELGLSAASLYRYYESKAALLAATRAAIYDRFAERIEAAYHSTKDLWGRSRAIGDAYVAFAFEEPAGYRLIFAYEQPEAEKTADLRRAELRAHIMMTSYVEDMVKAGLLEGDPETLGYVYWSALHGLIVLKMANKLDGKLSFDAIRHASARLITRGAAAP